MSRRSSCDLGISAQDRSRCDVRIAGNPQHSLRTAAKTSENAASAFGYQAAARAAIGDPRCSAPPSNATTEYSPSTQGVSRSIARSDHCRCVSTPRWARVSSKVTSIGRRLTIPAGIVAASSSGLVEK